MGKGRLEAFSDGVIAIILTIMVLELRAPEDTTFDALRPLVPVFRAYVMSFVFIGIYWNNHHHMLQATSRVNGKMLWANLHLLFWLSLVPFVTAWMGEHHEAPAPAAAYGVVLLGAAVAFTILSKTIVALHGAESTLAQAIGRSDVKGTVSLAMYVSSIPLAYVSVWLSFAIYVTTAAIWLVPDRRIESRLTS